jgi:hypothetical protein
MFAEYVLGIVAEQMNRFLIGVGKTTVNVQNVDEVAAAFDESSVLCFGEGQLEVRVRVAQRLELGDQL